MRFEDQGESDNIEDRRGSSGGGFGGGLPIGGRSIGVGTVVLALVAWYFGVDPNLVLNMGAQTAPPPAHQQAPRSETQEESQAKHLVGQVLKDTETTWTEIFQTGNAQYVKPKLVLFRDATPTACGTGEAAMGPFYCPGDQRVYLDLGFFDELTRRFRAPGQFAEAYVVAHEVGHHVQNLLGISEKVQAARERSGSKAASNALSVKLELQADCFAGLWAAHAVKQGRLTLDAGDVESAITAATAIGDDTLQRQAQGRVVPDSFTHGSSEQRVRWFRRGMDSGQIKQCDTFNAASL